MTTDTIKPRFWARFVRLEYLVLPLSLVVVLVVLILAWNVSRTSEANRQIGQYATANARNACAIKLLREEYAPETALEAALLRYYSQSERIDCRAFGPHLAAK